ncbi:MAG: HPF/RaiA family ribosome-associated protein [Candidatus Peribacteraceae bacterium]|jgi:ribosomal subunit interface protein
MNVQHFEKGFNYNDQQLLLIARKIGKLATYCKRLKDEASMIRVDAERRNTQKGRDKIKVSITVELPDKVLRAESRRPDPIEGIDRCIEKLEPQIKKYKDLHTLRSRPTRTRR